MKRGQKKPSKSEATEPPPVATAAAAPNVTAAPQPLLSLATIQNPGVVEVLPMLRDVAVPDRHVVFIRKVLVCCFFFDFSDTMKSAREKEIKRQTLAELVDIVQSGSCKLNEIMQEDMVKMISMNIFRCLPPAPHENSGADGGDPEEDDMFMDPAWPHLQLVYELLLRYVVSPDTDTKLAKRFIDHSFVTKLLELFDSEDMREREYLKTIVHRIYGRVPALHGSFLDKLEEVSIAHIFRFGNGFYGPVFDLVIILFVLVQDREQVSVILGRAALSGNNEHIVALIAENRHVILPIIFDALEKNIRSHWNQAINGLSANVRRMFQEMDAELFDECQRQHAAKEAMAGKLEEQRVSTWKRLEEVAAGTMGKNMVLV
ncbi:Serine/threonine protein phosphatase 2A regulatory subunit B' beta isoform [Sesamum angolense]|uniref:Serine/threonine protein phosphatase 2A regulatory subunit B' beta isoform n=1 Tax=Sesamum angolense TaxID=2727404 RepID=A0AAE2BZW8_9LAMI|nr:Serine/threonine protein phosphatase 2A regulatory subunit B' beta isoform [Sesamum angolense]